MSSLLIGNKTSIPKRVDGIDKELSELHSRIRSLERKLSRFGDVSAIRERVVSESEPLQSQSPQPPARLVEEVDEPSPNPPASRVEDVPVPVPQPAVQPVETIPVNAPVSRERPVANNRSKKVLASGSNKYIYARPPSRLPPPSYREDSNTDKNATGYLTGGGRFSAKEPLRQERRVQRARAIVLLILFAIVMMVLVRMLL